MLGQARVFAVLGREHLLPSWLARIHPTRFTPINATIVTGITAGAYSQPRSRNVQCLCCGPLGSVHDDSLAGMFIQRELCRAVQHPEAAWLAG